MEVEQDMSVAGTDDEALSSSAPAEDEHPTMARDTISVESIPTDTVPVGPIPTDPAPACTTTTTTTTVGRWAPFTAESMVNDVLSDDRQIRQWVVTGEIPFGRLVERILAEDPTTVATQARANLAEAERHLSGLHALGVHIRESRLLRAMPFLLAIITFVVVALGAVAVGLEAIEPVSGVTIAGLSLLLILEGIATSAVIFRKRRFRDTRIDPLKASVVDAEAAVRDATTQLHDALVDESVRPVLNTMANKNRGDLYRTTLSVVEHEGLAELDQSRIPIDTAAKHRLDYLLSEMPGGSVGLAGPRGAGKSTLMRAACPSARTGPIFGVMVAAPVQFEARDFILHLFAQICQRMLGTEVVDQLRRPDPVGDRIAAPRILPQVSLTAALLAMTAGAAMITYGLLPGKYSVNWVLIAGVTITTLGVLALAVWQRARYTYYSSYRHENTWDSAEGSLKDTEVFQLARSRLQDIWFQQSYTRGWSGSLSVPIGFTAGLEGTTELARQQMSMPDIIAELRRLVGLIAGGDVTVRIGIDELDKIESPHAAEQFMNEIKVLFGIPDCFFLVSVSEDAMSAFERRGLPFRDVFDSSFDDIVRVGHLNAKAAIELVQSRIIGMPVPFILLGHCMAGGLARDLIRVVRDMVSINVSRGNDRPLSDICGELLRADVAGKAESCVVACRRLPHHAAVERLQSWLRDLSRADITAGGLLTLCTEADTRLEFLRGVTVEDREGRTPADLAGEFLTFCYFSATLLDFFTDRRRGESFREVAEVGLDRSPIDLLAEARQAFAVHPRAAWDGVREFRREQGLVFSQTFPALA